MLYQQHDVNNSSVIPGGLALGLEQVGRGIVIECKDSGREFKEPEKLNRVDMQHRNMFERHSFIPQIPTQS